MLVGLLAVLVIGVGGLAARFLSQESPPAAAMPPPVVAPAQLAVEAPVAPVISPAPAPPDPPVVAVVQPTPPEVLAPKVAAPALPAVPAPAAVPAAVMPDPEPPAAPAPDAAVEEVAPVEPPLASLTSPLPQRKPAVPKVANAPAAKLTVKECLRRYNQAISSTSAQYNRLLAREGPSRPGKCRAIRQGRELMRDLAKEQSACLQLAGMEEERRETRDFLQTFDQDVREFCG